jgi:hypothetical protein
VCSPNVVPPSTCYVQFTNTPSDQWLEMRFSRSSVGAGSRFTVLLRDKHGDGLRSRAEVPAGNVNKSQRYWLLWNLSRAGDMEYLVGLFRVSEVIGVFNGDIREPESNVE